MWYILQKWSPLHILFSLPPFVLVSWYWYSDNTTKDGLETFVRRDWCLYPHVLPFQVEHNVRVLLCVCESVCAWLHALLSWIKKKTIAALTEGLLVCFSLPMLTYCTTQYTILSHPHTHLGTQNKMLGTGEAYAHTYTHTVHLSDTEDDVYAYVFIYNTLLLWNRLRESSRSVKTWFQMIP